jgi:LytS/YehU family sensor histidine kinase
MRTEAGIIAARPGHERDAPRRRHRTQTEYESENALNTVAGLIAEDPTRAERAIERLSSIFRYTLEASRRSRVPLRDEMEAVRHYLELEALRYEDRLVYEVTFTPEVANTPVVALLIQPLVENAVRHGVESRGRGNVRVRAELSGDEVVVSATDDGPGHGNSAHVGTRTSLRELRKRLELAFDGAARLSIGRSNAGGCSVELRLPRAT